MTSDDLIASVKRKIMFPTSQSTFTDDDILAFANEEMMISQVPQILSFHEEYFVTYDVAPLVAEVSRYPIPTRAIGMKLRGVFWCDNADGPLATNANLFDMTRVDSENKAYFQSNIGSNTTIHKYYLEGNDVVLTPPVSTQAVGSLVLYYFLRPNQLVVDNEAATIASFGKSITVSNASIVANDTVTIDGQIFTAVAGSPSTGQFQIGGSSIVTATNLVTAITTNGVVTAANGSTAIVTLSYSDRTIATTSSNSAGLSVSSLTICNVDAIPTSFSTGLNIDFLQTLPGHKTLGMSVDIPTNGITGTAISFVDDDLPDNIIVGDYICLENQCIIPQIPPDLHNGLAERTSGRILAALGDQQGLQATNQKIQEIDKSQGMLMDNRTEGEPRKILPRRSLLRFGRMGTMRKY